MASTEELEAQILAEMEANPEAYLVEPVNDILMIDPETRTISVPSSEVLFGARQDMDAERKHFKCPKIVGDNIDLSKCHIYISYVPSKQDGTYDINGDVGSYLCEDVAVDGDYITFSWKLSGNVFVKAGSIAFSVYAKQADTDGTLKTKWHTTFAIGKVLDTLPDGEQIAEKYADVIEQLLNKMESVEAIATPEAMQGYVNEYMGEHPVVPTNEQASEGINKWLDEHPEATTTVKERSIEATSFSDTLRNDNSFNNNQNLTTINYILEIAKDYMDDDSIVYNSELSPWYCDADATERGLTCSDWAMLALFGIKYENTKWFNSENTVGECTNVLQGLLDLKYSKAWSEQIAKYLDEKGLLYTPNNDLSNVAPGDILFYDIDSSNDSDAMHYPPTGETLTRYKGIDHSAVFVYKTTPSFYYVLEVPNDDGVVFNKISTSERKAVFGFHMPMNDLKYNGSLRCRLVPTSEVSNLLLNIDLWLSKSISKGFWFTVIIDGDAYSDSYFGVQYANSNVSWTTLHSRSTENFENYTNGKKAVILIRASDDIDRLRIISFARTSGGDRGMAIRKIEVYDGLNFGSMSGENYGLVNNPYDLKPINKKVITVNAIDNGEIYNSYDGCFYWKDGNRVHVHIGVSGLTSGNITELFTLPDGYRPYKETASFGIGDSLKNISTMSVTATGRVKVMSSSTFARADIEFDAFS